MGVACLISEQFDLMQQGIAELNDLLIHSQCVKALAYPLEPTLKGFEKEPVTTISVREYVGKSALSCATSSYNDLFIVPDLSQKVVRRTVGAIHLSVAHDPSAALVLGIVERINQSKDRIRQHLKTNYNTSIERHQALRLACPKVMTLHLYRHIRCLEGQNVLSARFAWQRKDALYTPDKEKLLESMNKTLNRTSLESQARLEKLIMEVSDTHREKLRLRRAVPVQPVINIKADGALKTMTAPMPLIFVQNEPIHFKSLTDFHHENKRKTRSDKNASNVLGRFGGIVIESYN